MRWICDGSAGSKDGIAEPGPEAPRTRPLTRRGSLCWTSIRLHVAQFHGMLERRGRVFPGGNEFLRHIALESCFQDHLHDMRILNLLSVIQFRSARTTGCVIVSDELLVLANSADDVAVHDLHVVDIEEQFQVWRANLPDDRNALVDVVAEVSRMSLHGMGVVAGIQVLEDERDSSIFGIANDLLKSLDTVSSRCVTINIVGEHSRKGDHMLRSDFLREIDPLLEDIDTFAVLSRIAEAFSEAVTTDERDFEAHFEQLGVEVGRDSFDGGHPQFLAECGQFQWGHWLETPPHNGLMNVVFEHLFHLVKDGSAVTDN